MSEPAPGTRPGQDAAAHGASWRLPACPHGTASADDRPEPREEILDAAGCLFVERGFAATPPRDIAEAAGIREPLIRAHFPAGKEEILAELLQRSIAPRLDNVEQIEDLRAATGAPPEVLLYALVALDVRTLARAPHNSGALARQAEVQHQAVGRPFRAAHDELLKAYTRLGGQVSDAARATDPDAPSSDFLGPVVLHLVESVVERRFRGDLDLPAEEASVATSCLLVCMADPTRLDEIGERAIDLIGRGTPQGVSEGPGA